MRCFFLFQAKPAIGSTMMYHRDTAHIPSAALLGGATLGEETFIFLSYLYELALRRLAQRRSA